MYNSITLTMELQLVLLNGYTKILIYYCNTYTVQSYLSKVFSLHIPQYLIPTLIPIKCLFF